MHKLIVSIAAVLGASGVASAGDVVPVSFSEMVKTAEVITVGSVTGVVSRTEDGGKTIRTYVTFEQLDLRKGQVEGGKLVLRLDGGDVGDDHLEVSGMPTFTRGHRYLVFVANNGKSLSPIVGYNQGAFEITRVGNRDVLKNVSGLELIGVENDRLVFALPPQPAVKFPDAVPVAGFKPVAGNPNADRLEAEALRLRQQQADARGVPQVPAKGVAPLAESPASPPPAPATTPVGQKDVVRPDVSPILIEATADKGNRASVQTLLTQARQIR
jgi:hypothetical protein